MSKLLFLFFVALAVFMLIDLGSGQMMFEKDMEEVRRMKEALKNGEMSWGTESRIYTPQEMEDIFNGMGTL
ncbi:hypothetical protein TKK_0004490 [Trichogramma kaykai]